MKFQFAGISLVILTLASCSKDDETTKNNEETKPKQVWTENQTNSSPRAEVQDRNSQINKATKPTPSQTENDVIVRPKGVSSSDESWNELTEEQKLAEFQSKGIAGMPKHISAPIVENAAIQSTPGEKVNFITEQAAAWHHVDKLRQSNNSIPDQIETHLIDMLTHKHGESWTTIATEFDEQIAASDEVMKLRFNGIPGNPGIDMEKLYMEAVEKHLPDYKAMLRSLREEIK